MFADDLGGGCGEAARVTQVFGLNTSVDYRTTCQDRWGGTDLAWGGYWLLGPEASQMNKMMLRR